MAILLQENGDALLQEIGDYILLEFVLDTATVGVSLNDYTQGVSLNDYTQGVSFSSYVQGVDFQWGEIQMSEKLGPMSTPGIADFWVSLDKILEPAETLSSVDVVSADSDLTPSLEDVVSSDFTDSQRKTVPADRALYFRLTTTEEIDADVNLTIDWTTSSGEEQTGTVVVECVPKHTEWI